ncbi:MAG: hypothetical protein GX847_04330 [Clostridiales bacterium]|nr:hypothetical protein [Clostridiales bacterium]
MAIVYTKAELLEKVDEYLTPENVSKLYAQDFIIYTGVTADTKEPYTEVVAERLLSNLTVFESIKSITRESSYKTAGHKWQPIDSSSPRSEEQIARSMMDQTYNYIGKIIDYQTPLKNVLGDEAGKIDLLSCNEAERRVYILEFKAQDSKETLLRCVLEAYTYGRIVNTKKLLKDFGHKDFTLRKAVLVYERSRPYTDFDNPIIKKLMRALGVDLFVLNSDNQIVEAHYYG